MDEATAQTNQLEFVTLVAGEQSFCIEITLIREIRRWSPVTVLPHSPDHVLGVMNLRGAVIPIIDLAAKLGFEPIEPTARHVIIIVAMNSRIIGLLVDSVSEIISIGADEVRETPMVREDETSNSIQGVIMLGEDMTRIINLDSVIPELAETAA